MITHTHPAKVAQKSFKQSLYQFINGDGFTALVFLAIPVLLLVITKFYPIFYNIGLSFTSYDLSPITRFVGFNNYTDILSSPVFQKSIYNTFLFVIGAVPVGIILSLIIAALLNQKIRGRVIFRTLFYLPVVTSVLASSLVWRWIFNPEMGLLNSGLKAIGVQGPGWLSDPNWAMVSLVIIQLWMGLGGNMVIFLAGLQDIPVELYESAQMDGAKGYQSFLYVTIPMLRPITVFVVVTYTIAIFRNFGLIFLLTQGGPSLSTNTMVWEIYQNAFGYLRFGLGAAISVILLLTILLIALPFRVFEMAGENR